MFKNTIFRAALALAIGASFGAAQAQDAAANRAHYSRGAAYFVAGEYSQAAAEFDAAVAGKTNDPRVYFFRGLCAARQNDVAAAAEFYAKGAELEVNTETGRLSAVSDALASVQGDEREQIELARQNAKSAWKEKEFAKQKAVYKRQLSEERVNTATRVTSDEAAPAKSSAASVAPIRPFLRSEIPAGQVPDVSQRSSNLDYFRKDLDKKELSTSAKKRIEALASRVVYDDPMDKPAADGTPFLDIYAYAEIYADGKAFVGDDDNDTIYDSAENNILAKFAAQCDSLSVLASTLFPSVAAEPAANAPYGMGMGGMSAGPAMPMPSMTPMDPSVAPGGAKTDGLTAGPGGAAPSAAAKPAADAKPDPNGVGDTKLLFENAEPIAPTFTKENNLKLDADDLDLFKEARDFQPKPAAAPARSESSGSMGGPMGGMVDK